MRKIIIKYTFFSILACFLFSFISVFAADNNQIVLENLKLKKLSDKELQVNIFASEKFPTKPLLFEKSKNVYLISLPATKYEGERNVPIPEDIKGVDSISVDFVPYKTIQGTGYTRILIRTQDNLKLSVVEGAGPLSVGAIIFIVLTVLIFLAIISYLGFVLYTRIKHKKRVTPDSLIEDYYPTSKNKPIGVSGLLKMEQQMLDASSAQDVSATEKLVQEESQAIEEEKFEYQEEIVEEVQPTEEITEDVQEEPQAIEEETFEYQEEIVEEVQPTEEITEDVLEEPQAIEEETFEYQEEIVEEVQSTEEITEDVMEEPQAIEEETFEYQEEIVEEVQPAEEITEEVQEEPQAIEEEKFEYQGEIVEEVQPTEEITEDVMEEPQAIEEETFEYQEEIVEEVQSTEEITVDVLEEPQAIEEEKFEYQGEIVEEVQPAEEITEEVLEEPQAIDEAFDASGFDVPENIQPSADEIVLDILNNEDALGELSDSIIENNDVAFSYTLQIDDSDEIISDVEQIEEFNDSLEDFSEENELVEAFDEDVLISEYEQEFSLDEDIPLIDEDGDSIEDAQKEEEIIVEQEEQPAENDYTISSVQKVSEVAVFSSNTFDFTAIAAQQENTAEEQQEEIQEEQSDFYAFDELGFSGVMADIPDVNNLQDNNLELSDLSSAVSEYDIETEEQTEEEIDLSAFAQDETEETEVELSDETEEQTEEEIDLSAFAQDASEETEFETAEESEETSKEHTEENNNIIDVEVLLKQSDSSTENPYKAIFKDSAKDIQKAVVSQKFFVPEEDDETEDVPDINSFFVQDTDDVAQVFEKTPVEPIIETKIVDVIEEVDDSQPLVLDQKEFTKEKQLYLLRHNGEYSLVATMNENVFVVEKFDDKPDKEEIILKHNETRKNDDVYIVKVGNWRALLSVSEDEVKNILTL